MPVWLIVEDEEDIHDVIMGMFEVWGINGQSFDNGLNALDWLDKVDAGLETAELPQLALLDIRLPGDISGVEIAERIRQSNVLGDIVVVLITAYYLSPEEERAIKNRVYIDALIYKPLPEISQFRAMLNDLFAHR